MMCFIQVWTALSRGFSQKSEELSKSSSCFLLIFFVSRYEKWLAGEDLGHHPTDEQKTSAMTVAPAPSAEEFLINRTNNDREVGVGIYCCLSYPIRCMFSSWFSLAKLEIVTSSCPWTSLSRRPACTV